MSAIGGPGGIGGPKGPGGPGPVDDLGDASEVGESAAPSPAAPARVTDIDAIAADLAAGKLTAHEAIDRLVDQIAGSEHLAASERAELREMMQDLVANDPYLSGLLQRT